MSSPVKYFPLNRPEVLGQVSESAFEALVWQGNDVIGRKLSMGPSSRQALCDEVTSIGGFSPSDKTKMLIRSGQVRPFSTQVENFDYWHTDSALTYGVANLFNTEFLIGDESVIASLWERAEQVPDAPEAHAYQIGQTAILASHCNDEDLAAIGFEIWAPPLERQVVKMTFEHVHRLPRNPNDYPVDRKVLLLMPDGD